MRNVIILLFLVACLPKKDASSQKPATVEESKLSLDACAQKQKEDGAFALLNYSNLEEAEDGDVVLGTSHFAFQVFRVSAESALDSIGANAQGLNPLVRSYFKYRICRDNDCSPYALQIYDEGLKYESRFANSKVKMEYQRCVMSKNILDMGSCKQSDWDKERDLCCKQKIAQKTVLYPKITSDSVSKYNRSLQISTEELPKVFSGYLQELQKASYFLDVSPYDLSISAIANLAGFMSAQMDADALKGITDAVAKTKTSNPCAQNLALTDIGTPIPSGFDENKNAATFQQPNVAPAFLALGALTIFSIYYMHYAKEPAYVRYPKEFEAFKVQYDGFAEQMKTGLLAAKDLDSKLKNLEDSLDKLVKLSAKTHAVEVVEKSALSSWEKLRKDVLESEVAESKVAFENVFELTNDNKIKIKQGSEDLYKGTYHPLAFDTTGEKMEIHALKFDEKTKTLKVDEKMPPPSKMYKRTALAAVVAAAFFYTAYDAGKSQNLVGSDLVMNSAYEKIEPKIEALVNEYYAQMK